MGRGCNRQERVVHTTEKHKSQQSMVQEILKANIKRFGFFSGVCLHLINCPNEGEALIRPMRESTWEERGRKWRVD